MLILGDCIEKMRGMPENSIDAIVTDPPYGWRFMGKAWDGTDIIAKQKRNYSKTTFTEANGKVRTRSETSTPIAMAAGEYDLSLTGNQSFQLWTEDWAKEAFRVLKPGGHMLIFCGPRTYHRMASGVEDAGFEIRDQLQWLFGSGFPKSLNLSKAIDKKNGWDYAQHPEFEPIPVTPDAKKLQGLGTALKPANEPIVLARKPLEKGLTVAENVLKWGTGGLNIDGCRIPGAIPVVPQPEFNTTGEIYNMKTGIGRNGEMSRAEGRFPANLILDETAAEMLDEQTGKLAGGGPSSGRGFQDEYVGGKVCVELPIQKIDKGGFPSRFFYCAKSSKSERNKGLEGMLGQSTYVRSGANNPSPNRQVRSDNSVQNTHPTVKPIKLMRYLCRLITPPNGTVLDPFMGSGSTGVAAREENFKFIGIELDKSYFDIAERRINIL